jgi:hypothetical protein
LFLDLEEFLIVEAFNCPYLQSVYLPPPGSKTAFHTRQKLQVFAVSSPVSLATGQQDNNAF